MASLARTAAAGLYKNSSSSHETCPSASLLRRSFTLLPCPSSQKKLSSLSLRSSFSQSTARREISTGSRSSSTMAANGSKLAGQPSYAVITGANKGIGFETARQLASNGVTIILTARDEKRGLEATSKLHEMGFPNVVFHQLDVLDPKSAESLASFVKEKFGWLDILVNNAGASGVIVDADGLRALNIDPADWLAGRAANLVQSVMKQTYESGELCLNTNYYGVKRVTEALLPLLQLSPSGARVVNISSLRSELRRIPNEQTRKELGDLDNLTEEKIDAVVQKFLRDLKANALEENGWSIMLPSYSVSKATLNAYTRVLAKKYPSMCVNCVHPGFVDTDINWHTGTMTVEEGARGPVMLALFPEGSPTGCYFSQTEMVNNAGASGVIVDEDGLRALNIDPVDWLAGRAAYLVQSVIKQTYESGELCLNTNYYGVKRVTEALLPLLQLSPSGARVVNVSSLRGELRRIPNEQTRKELGDLDNLTEEKIDAVVQKFLRDLKADALEENGWSIMLPSYSVSKATLNAYTRVLAKKYPSMCINCVHPGFVDADINWHIGTMTPEEGARGPVMLALFPEGSPTGCYFSETEMESFDSFERFDCPVRLSTLLVESGL